MGSNPISATSTANHFIMIILGIETCDETAIGILEAKTKAGFFIKPLSNVISSQIKTTKNMEALSQC